MFIFETQEECHTRRKRFRNDSSGRDRRSLYEQRKEEKELKRSSALEISNRRREMLRKQRLGVEPREFIPTIAAKYGVKVDAVKKDWSKRENWMKILLKMEDAQSLVSELLLEFDIIREETQLLVEQEENSKIKTQQLYLSLKVAKERKELLRELGVFEILKCYYKSKAREHSRKLLEEEFPWMKGNRDLLNSVMALAKASGKYPIEKLLEIERMCADACH